MVQVLDRESTKNSHKTNHVEEGGEKIKQYNCKDCPFQGENGLELKRHIQRTKHRPSEHIEECYTCKKEFSSYWDLMNHRKTEHPSSRPCRYFVNDECRFDSEKCWYRHVDNSKHESREIELNLQCNVCDDNFNLRSDLMSHKKTKHPDKVSKCKLFSQGNCTSDENSCWFVHQTEQKEDEAMDTRDSTNESVFHKAEEKTPPDQMSSILTMIKRLSFQVEELEKRSKQTQ